MKSTLREELTTLHRKEKSKLFVELGFFTLTTSSGNKQLGLPVSVLSLELLSENYTIQVVMECIRLYLIGPRCTLIDCRPRLITSKTDIFFINRVTN